MVAGEVARTVAAPSSVGPGRGWLVLRPTGVKVAEFSRSEGFGGGRVVLGTGRREGVKANVVASPARVKLNPSFGKSYKWWEKGLQRNMREVQSAQHLVDSLKNAGDHLVIVGFYSPSCGGCKALHPKICQFAEKNPEVLFLQVNYEDHKSMCYSLHVHVLPFFRFYRGAQGRLCSFSCTNATINKFKDALAKHTPPRCSLGPTKGLEESELIALAENKDLNFVYTESHPDPVPASPGVVGGEVLSTSGISFSPAPVFAGYSEDKQLVVHPRM